MPIFPKEELFKPVSIVSSGYNETVMGQPTSVGDVRGNKRLGDQQTVKAWYKRGTKSARSQADATRVGKEAVDQLMEKVVETVLKQYGEDLDINLNSKGLSGFIDHELLLNKDVIHDEVRTDLGLYGDLDLNDMSDQLNFDLVYNAKKYITQLISDEDERDDPMTIQERDKILEMFGRRCSSQYCVYKDFFPEMNEPSGPVCYSSMMYKLIFDSVALGKQQSMEAFNTLLDHRLALDEPIGMMKEKLKCVRCILCILSSLLQKNISEIHYDNLLAPIRLTGFTSDGAMNMGLGTVPHVEYNKGTLNIFDSKRHAFYNGINMRKAYKVITDPITNRQRVVKKSMEEITTENKKDGCVTNDELSAEDVKKVEAELTTYVDMIESNGLEESKEDFFTELFGTSSVMKKKEEESAIDRYLSMPMIL